MRDQWVDIDLDYFNDYTNPLVACDKMLRRLPPSTMMGFFIEHHHVLPTLRKAVQIGKLHTPMTIFRVDDHHDYYGGDPKVCKDAVHCGNFGYMVPVSWYNQFIWVTRADIDGDEEWVHAKRWLRDKGKRARISRSWCWDYDRVGLVTVTLSPDYLYMSHYVGAMLELIADYFDEAKRPFRRPNESLYDPHGWSLRKRMVNVPGY